MHILLKLDQDALISIRPKLDRRPDVVTVDMVHGL